MQDLTLPYPLFRSENRNRFESLLRQDRRNQAIVDLLPAPTVDNALRDLLLNGILTVQMQEQIAGLLRGGVTNPSLAGWLAASFDQADAGSMTLETGPSRRLSGKKVGRNQRTDFAQSGSYRYAAGL